MNKKKKQTSTQLNPSMPVQFLSLVTVCPMTGIAKQLSKMRSSHAQPDWAFQEEEELIIYAKVDEAELRGDVSTALTTLCPLSHFRKTSARMLNYFGWDVLR